MPVPYCLESASKDDAMDDQSSFTNISQPDKTASIDSSFLDILEPFPVMSAVVEQLDVWDLIQLSRTCVSIRAICHGFPGDQADPSHNPIRGTGIRPTLQIGLHHSPTWELFKRLAAKRCRELDHTRGRAPSGCKICSKPVCLACIVKHSIGRRENTFHHRARALCMECFKTGNPHSCYIQVQGGSKVLVDYSQAGLCQCTSNDGVLCLDCKEQQNQESIHRYKQICAGTNCGQFLSEDSRAGRICIWCNSILPTATQRQSYDTGLVGLWGAYGEADSSRRIIPTKREPRDESWIAPPQDSPLPVAVQPSPQSASAIPAGSDSLVHNSLEVPPYAPTPLSVSGPVVFSFPHLAED